MSNFNFNPTVNNANFTSVQQTNGSNVDYDALLEYQLEKLGGVGTYDRICVFTNIYEVGEQEREEQVLEFNAATEKDHGWRLEMSDKGNVQRDPTARKEMRNIKGKSVECLVFDQLPVTQAVISVDCPEVMLDIQKYFTGESSTDKPFRAILGENGFVPRAKWGKNIIARPFNLRHTNVNRNKEGAKPLYALAKNSALHDYAEWTGQLDSEGNFRNTDLGKLIGQPVNCEMEVKVESWDNTAKGGSKGRRLVVNVTPKSKLSPRDLKYYQDELANNITDDLFGVVMFGSDTNDENAIKNMRKSVFNTMVYATNWESSKLKQQIMKVKPDWFGDQGEIQEKPKQETKPQYSSQSKPAEQPTPQQSYSPDLDDGWDDSEIPF